MPSICYLFRNQSETVSHIFGQCEYIVRARGVLKDRYNQHLDMNFAQGNYAEAILQQSRIFQKGKMQLNIPRDGSIKSTTMTGFVLIQMIEQTMVVFSDSRTFYDFYYFSITFGLISFFTLSIFYIFLSKHHWCLKILMKIFSSKKEKEIIFIKMLQHLQQDIE
jgi:hypothetical protein